MNIRKPLVSGLFVGGALMLSLSACSTNQACPAMGYVPSIKIVVTGAHVVNPKIQVCGAGSCSPVMINTPGGTNNDGKVRVQQLKGDTFTAIFETKNLPDRVTVNVFEKQGVVKEQTQSISWHARSVNGCNAGWDPITVTVKVP